MVPKILETPYIDGKAPYKEEIDMLKNKNLEILKCMILKQRFQF